MAETHEHIPTEVIGQDIRDTEREIEQMQREMEYFEKSPPGSPAYRLDQMRAEYRKDGIRKRREFIEKLRGILQTREGTMTEIPRAVLSIDGSHACALLGKNLQEGEAEFVEILYPDGKNASDAYKHERTAAFAALHKLRERLGIEITYALGKGLEEL